MESSLSSIFCLPLSSSSSSSGSFESSLIGPIVLGFTAVPPKVRPPNDPKDVGGDVPRAVPKTLADGDAPNAGKLLTTLREGEVVVVGEVARAGAGREGMVGGLE